MQNFLHCTNNETMLSVETRFLFNVGVISEEFNQKTRTYVLNLIELAIHVLIFCCYQEKYRQYQN